MVELGLSRRRYKSRFAAAVIIGADHISFIFWIRAAGIIKRIKPAHNSARRSTALRNLMASYTYIYLSLEKPLTSSSPMSHECCGERAGMVSAYNIGSAALPFLIRQYAAVNVLGARERFFVAPIIAARRIFFFGRENHSWTAIMIVKEMKPSVAAREIFF